MQAQRRGGADPHSLGHVGHRQVRRLQELPGTRDPLLGQPLVGARAGLAIADDGTASGDLVDAVMVHGDEWGLTDRLGELAEQHDEMLVTLETSGNRRDDEDVLLRALGNVTRVLARAVQV